MFHVCRAWRGVALEMGSLVAKPILLNRTIARTMVEAARSRPLTLVAELGRRDFHGAEIVGEILNRGIGRAHTIKSLKLVGHTAPMLLAFLSVYGLHCSIESLYLKTSGPFGCTVLSALEGPKILRNVTRLVLHLHRIRSIPAIGSCLKLFMRSEKFTHLSVGPAPFGNVVVFTLAVYKNPDRPEDVLLPALRNLILDGLDDCSAMGSLLRWGRGSYERWQEEMYSRMPAGVDRLPLDRDLLFFLNHHLEHRTRQGKTLTSVTLLQERDASGRRIGKEMRSRGWPQELFGTPIKSEAYCGHWEDGISWSNELAEHDTSD
jgi:hypothetical protein